MVLMQHHVCLLLCPQSSQEATADLEHRTLPCCQKEGTAKELDSPLGSSGSISLSNCFPVEERQLPEAKGGRPSCKNASRLSSPNCAQETAVEEKPLQGLLKCLKDLIVHQPLPSHQASRTVSTGGRQEAPERKRREVGSGPPPIQVKTETPEKEPPAWEGSSPLVTPASGISNVQTGGGRRAGTPEREKGCPLATVKTERVAASSPPRPLDGRGHAFGAHRAAEKERTAKETEAPCVKIKTEDDPPLEVLRGCLKEAPEEEERDQPAPLRNHPGASHSSSSSRRERGLWVPYAGGSVGGPSASCLEPPFLVSEADWSPATSPLHGLLNCLREIPIPGPERAKTLAGKTGGGGGKERRKGGRRGPLDLCGDRTTPENLCEVSSCSRTPPASTVSGLGPPARGPERHSKELPLSMCSQPASPAISSSISSSPDRLTRWTPEPRKWARKEEGLGRNGPPLQGLERCLRDLPLNARSQPPSPATSSSLSGSSDRPHRWTPESGNWGRKEEGLSRSGPPSKGLERRCLKDFPPHMRSQPPSPALSSSFSGSSEGLHRWTPEAGKWARKEEGASPPGIPPLQGLENCLKEIPVGGNSLPNCFTATGFFCTQKLRRGDAESRRPWAGGGPKDSLPRCPTNTSGCVEANVESSPLHRLMSCLKEVPIRRPSYLNTPSISSASSSCSESERDRQSPESGAWWDSSQAPAGGILVHSPQNSPKVMAAGGSDPSAPDSSDGTLDREAEQNRLDSRRQHPPADAKRKGTASSARLQGLADYLAEMPASPCHRSQTPAGDSQGSSEHREQGGPKSTASVEEDEGRLAESSPLQGLLQCLKEITARGPDPRSSSASNAGGETRRLPAEEDSGHRRPASRERLVSTSAPLCAAGRCTGVSGNGSVCVSNGRSPSHSAQRQSGSRSPKSGMKRSLLTAQDGDPQVPGAPSCTFSSGASAESGDPPKKRCPSLDQPPPLCRWGKADAREGQAEDGDLGPVLSQKLDRLSEDMSAVCRDVSRMQSHMDRLEQDARGWVLELAALRMENRCLSEYVRRMESRCRTLEGRSRRNNLRLLGLPEGVEGSDAVSFLQKTLPAMLGWQPDAPPLEIESARRVQGGVSWEANGRPPRALVFRLLRFADKATLLQAARTRPLSYAGTQVTILPDLCSWPSPRRRVPLGAFRRTRWAADLCFAARHSSSCYTWAQGLREPPAGSGPLSGEREGRVSKRTGTGGWNMGPSAGAARHSMCHSTGSPE
ncbi:PREDICTED: protein KRBA1 [Gekko japonicus]|uniref:Protein KRBA1 n=1 Tax=Gekko japonicus TaxID=146911 RepID=A0ABM1K9T6_GEKJA|nr:PREDICTED: protein KRBA1 [Gekko japonicus]